LHLKLIPKEALTQSFLLKAEFCLTQFSAPLLISPQYQPPILIVWGKNDYIFPAEGAYPYQPDLKDVELHLLDTGHFALEEEGEVIANYIAQFLASRLQPIPA
jgi:pimeloyl-ACP methyl ester carboxylesterase